MRGMWFWILWLVAAVSTGGAGGCSPIPMQRFEYSRMLMGVRATVTLYSRHEHVAFDNAAAALDEIGRLEDILSDYQRNSEAAMLTAGPPGQWRDVSQELWDVLDRSADLWHASGGLFDPTLGPQVALWRRARALRALPEAAEVEDARSRSGMQSLELRPGQVKLTKPGMKLDFGGIGKGYAAQRALDLLVARGSPMAMVAIAGDVAVGEPPPGERGWIVAVDSGQPRSTPRLIRVRHRAVSTSGDTEQFVDIAGNRYAHIVDPRTGLGATIRRSATVIAGAGWLADALGKPGVLGGRELVEALARRYHAAFIVTESDGTTSIEDPYRIIEADQTRNEATPAAPSRYPPVR